MDKTCGSKIPNGIVASSNLMLVEFITDGAHTASGFQATFTAGKSDNKENGNENSPCKINLSIHSGKTVENCSLRGSSLPSLLLSVLH